MDYDEPECPHGGGCPYPFTCLDLGNCELDSVDCPACKGTGWVETDTLRGSKREPCTSCRRVEA